MLSYQGLVASKSSHTKLCHNFYASSTHASQHIYPGQQQSLNPPYVICNHTLSHKFTSCGQCNILGSLPRGPLHRYNSVASLNQLDTNWIILRSIHTSTRSFKDESKVEKTVKALKDQTKKVKESAEELAAITDLPDDLKKEAAILKETTAEAPKPAGAAPSSTTSDTTVAAPVKKSIGQRIIHEIKHYYHGFKLLFTDVKVCARYVWYILNGRGLTRRERRQLVRTTADLFRLVPFLVFIVVPFMEFLLPVALKLFPNMLPSTFAEASKEQEKLRSKLKVKLEMAKFLQDTIEETSLLKKGAKGESAAEFAAFLEKIRTTGTETNVEEIRKYSKLFEDEITLDTLSHRQLMALCRLLDIPMPNLGTTNFLRFQLRLKLRQLETDDKMIMKEGIDSLAVWELQEACRSRGMRSLGVPTQRLKSQLSQWLQLHLEESIPTSLLLLSRALYMPEHLSTEEQLKATIAELPVTAAEEAKVKISEVSGERVDNKTKLDVIKQEEQAIWEEKEQAKRKEKEQEAIKKKAAEEEAKRAEQELLMEEETKKEVEAITQAAATPVTPSIVDSDPELKPSIQEVLVDTATDITEAKEAEVKKELEEEEISAEELEHVEDIIGQVAEEKKMALEKKELEALKEDVEEYKEAVSELKEVVLATGGQDIEESKAAQRLGSIVSKMMQEMEHATGKLFEEKQALMEDIEVKEVRIKRSTALAENTDAREKVLDEISANKEHLISINELMLSMRKIQKVPDDTRLQRILQVLDEDQDGSIDISDALKVIELLGKDNMKLSSTQVTDIINLIKRETEIEKEEKETKLKEKQEKLQTESQISDPEILDAKPEEILKDSATDVEKKEQQQKQ